MLQVVVMGIGDDNLFAVSFAAGLGNRNAFFAAQVLSGDRLGIFDEFFGCALCNHGSTEFPGARTNLQQVVCFFNRFFVMLHHEHGVTQITQLRERGDQSAVIALVQANRGFIKHVQDSLQCGTNLRGQADTLRFSTGECCSRARHSEVLQAHVLQEGEARDNLCENFFDDRVVVIRKRHGVTLFSCGDQRREKSFRFFNAHVCSFDNVLVADRHAQDLLL